jgi:hypothetical protein
VTVDNIISFLNANAGVLNLLFAVVVAAATVVYAWLTAKLVAETRQLREAQTEPRIEVFYRPRDEWIALLDIVIKNIGSGPAYDLTFSCSAIVPNKGSEELLSRLKELKSLSSGIAYLGPGQEFFSYWTRMTDNFKEKLETQILVRSNYRSATGRAYARQHVLDLSELKGVERIGEPPLLKIAKNVEKFQEQMQRLSTGFEKLKVDVFTHDDRERERKESEEERERLTGSKASE